jgi:cation diffusion facilitator CzcD-associated flavoprotein CzcO
MPDQHDSKSEQPMSFDVVIVGAGFAGVYALHRLRSLGFSCVVIESAEGVGGTWFHNRYPGARCDIESLDYSYSFDDQLQQEWHWTERYAAQPEILRYINHVVDRFDLRKDIVLGTRVDTLELDERAGIWRVGATDRVKRVARFCIMASGVLSAAQMPKIPGLESFQGRSIHTANWPEEEVNFSGRRVGVIGTGSSGTQLIPLVAAQAKHLTVFQRTANYCMPAQNRPLDEATEVEWKAHYAEKRRFARGSGFGHNQLSNDAKGVDLTAAERKDELERRWELGGLYMMRAFKDIMIDPSVNKEAVEFVWEKIDQIVRDPTIADALKPSDLYIGTKRLCSGTGYYETFNRDNVELVDVHTHPIERITPQGVLVDGRLIELDDIVLATGFDAMTGSFLRIDPQGRGGLKLSERWRGGPTTYLGLSVPDFPNLFLVAGPGSPSVFSNMVTSIEQHVEWISDCLVYLRDHDLHMIEARASAEQAWVEHVDEVSRSTLYRHSKNTWFYGANTPGKPVVFMPYLGGVGRYATTITGIANRGYEGFDTAVEVRKMEAKTDA